MPHKLLITLHFKRPIEEFSSLINRNEFPRGEQVIFTYNVINLGDSDFNGVLKEIRAKFKDGTTSISKPDSPITSLAKNEERMLYKIEFDMQSEGTAWISAKLEADDKQKIDYYQRKDSPPIQDDWQMPIYVVSRETLTIIKLLTEIRDKITNQTK